MNWERDPITGKFLTSMLSGQKLFELLCSEGLEAWNSFEQGEKDKLQLFLNDKWLQAKVKPEPYAALHLYEMLKMIEVTGAPIHGEYVDA